MHDYVFREHCITDKTLFVHTHVVCDNLTNGNEACLVLITIGLWFLSVMVHQKHRPKLISMEFEGLANAYEWSLKVCSNVFDVRCKTHATAVAAAVLGLFDDNAALI